MENPTVTQRTLRDITPKRQRVGFYARVSSEEQTQGYSIDAQLRAGQQLAADRGLEFVPYVEPGRSAKGEDLRRRPTFRQLVEDAVAGHVSMVAVHKLDRFSRNLRVTLEQFERLGKADVTFVSLTENLDFSTPWGRLALAMLGALAQFYSENLGQETSKGKQERKAQGLYNGFLPFGMIKGPTGIPIADRRPHALNGRETTNFDGLLLAFQEAAKGHTDLEVARSLNAAGYRTTGNRGTNPFTKDTIAELLTNRFYLGELPVTEKVRGADGKTRRAQTGWATGKHAAVLDAELFQAVQEARAQNRTSPRTIRTAAEPWSLSGLALCVTCHSRLHAYGRGNRRVICYGHAQGKDCAQRSAYLAVYEAQIQTYLHHFVIPPDYQRRILGMYSELRGTLDPSRQDRATLRARLERIKELYEWGDYGRAKYLAEKAEIQKQLMALAPEQETDRRLERLAAFLKDLPVAWEHADSAQRNRLARRLFQEVWIGDQRVVAVKPQPELAPFFTLDCQTRGCTCGTDGIRMRYQQRPQPGDAVA